MVSWTTVSTTDTHRAIEAVFRIEWAKRFRKIVGDGDSIVQEVFGG